MVDKAESIPDICQWLDFSKLCFVLLDIRDLGLVRFLGFDMHCRQFNEWLTAHNAGCIFAMKSLNCERSDQLRELHKSLKTAETSPQTKRPSAALSPEVLTDAEWYYLVCMSFIFNFGKG
ncbi:putative basic helix-loop-helix protein A [Spatholobus suberectus]|nr:putative basic helix-loop-helix protein A [Spatholobus suberectus]